LFKTHFGSTKNTANRLKYICVTPHRPDQQYVGYERDIWGVTTS